MNKLVEVKRIVDKVNDIYTKRGYSQRSVEDISTMVTMAKDMKIAPSRFLDFVTLLADGKTFEEARNVLRRQT